MWQEPIFDRTNADTLTARAGQSNIENHKGALNYQDLNRIEQNFQYVVQHLFDNAMVIPHTKREYTETMFEYVEKENSILPDGYTQVEYIQSSGTQYIDTGFIHNNNTRVVMDAQVTTQPSTHAWLFEGRDKTGVAHKSVFLLSGTAWKADYSDGSTGYRATISSVGITDRLNIDYNKNSLKVNNFTHTWTVTSFQSNYNLTLLAANTGGTVDGFISAKLYSCKIYDNGTLVRNFIPCKNASGTVGLYDLVNGKFYENLGTGTFTAGIEIEPETTYELIETKTTYTDWQEHNVPWRSEIDRIRENFNSLTNLFLHGLGLPVFSSSQYLMYDEVNDWERIAFIGKQMFENMEKEYLRCNTVICGGGILL